MSDLTSKNLYMQILKQVQLQAKADKMVCTDGGREVSGFSESKDCTVRALAIAAGMPYAQAHAHLKAHGRVNRKGARNDLLQRAYLPYCGEFTWIRPSERGTVAAFMRNHPVGTYIVNISCHVFAVIDGVQHDNGGGLYRPRCKVLGFWKV